MPDPTEDTLKIVPTTGLFDVPGGWQRRTLVVEQQQISLRLPAAPERLLDELGDGSPFAPYWAALWPAAETLAAQVLRHDWATRGPAVELGCGCGLVGLAAAHAGIKVTFTDYVPQAVELARRNALDNGHSCSGCVLDWQRPTGPQFPVVLGSDVCYDRELFEPLLNTIMHVLDPGGVCWLADPGRSSMEDFLRRAVNRGLSYELRDETGRRCNHPPGCEYCLIILRHSEPG